MYKFLKEIEHTNWVVEVLIERFDQSIFEIMPDSALIYGGAIRDILAEQPLQGDLDIAIPSIRMADVRHKLSDHPKWTEVVKNVKAIKTEEPQNVHPMPVDVPEPQNAGYYPSYDVEITSIPGEIEVNEVPNDYKKEKVIENVRSFVGVNGAEIQLISAKCDNNAPLKNESYAVIELIKKVDMICCGVVMDKRGKVFEALDGAFDDCLNKSLRFNRLIIRTAALDNIEARVKKLEKRGWKSFINLKKIENRQKKLLAADKKRKELRTKKNSSKKRRRFKKKAPKRVKPKAPKLAELPFIHLKQEYVSESSFEYFRSLSKKKEKKPAVSESVLKKIAQAKRSNVTPTHKRGMFAKMYGAKFTTASAINNNERSDEE